MKWSDVGKRMRAVPKANSTQEVSSIENSVAPEPQRIQKALKGNLRMPTTFLDASVGKKTKNYIKYQVQKDDGEVVFGTVLHPQDHPYREPDGFALVPIYKNEDGLIDE